MKGPEYHVHICCIGTSVDPSVAMTRSGIPIDSVYLLSAKDGSYPLKPEMDVKLNAAREEIENTLKKNGIPEVNTISVYSWDFQEIIDCILDIASDEDSKHTNVKYHINFTSGTHVMAGAVCCAAFYIGADLYYVMNKKEHPGLSAENETRRFEIPFLPDVEKLKGPTTRVLSYLEEGEKVSNGDLLSKTGLTPSRLGYHTRLLKDYGLIEQERKGNVVSWKLTYSGKVAVKILNRDLRRSKTKTTDSTS